MERKLAAFIMMLLTFAAGAGAQGKDRVAVPQETVVTPTGTERSIGDVSQSVTVLTGDQIRKSSALTVAEALEAAVDVVVADGGPRGAQQTLSMRGADDSRVLVLLDGIRLHSPRDPGFDLSALPVTLENIERIEIVRGASSALYGADAVGGVVNIITKKSAANQAVVGGSLGSHGYDTLSAGNSGKQGAWRYTLSGMRGTSDGYRLNSNLREWIAGGRIGYDISTASTVELTGNYLSKENGVPGSLQFPSPSVRQRERVRVFGLSYRERLSKTIDLTLSGFRSQDDLHLQDPAVPITSRNESRTDGGKAQLSWLANSWNLITAGYETGRAGLRSTDSGNHAASLESGYIQDEITVNKALMVIVGDRYDKHSVYGEKSSPRIGGRYRFQTAGTILRAFYGESFRAPTFNELYSVDPSAPGNPDLKPESAKEIEAGIEQPLGGEAVLTATFFERKMTDLIVRQTSIVPAPVSNTGRADIKGAEADASFRLRGEAALAVNYTYLKPIDEATGERIYAVSIPRTQIKCSLGMQLDREVHLSLERRMVEHYTRPGEPLWRYAVFDGKIAQVLSDGKSEIYFSMQNILDRRYETFKGLPMPPKEIFGGLSLVF